MRGLPAPGLTRAANAFQRYCQASSFVPSSTESHFIVGLFPRARAPNRAPTTRCRWRRHSVLQARQWPHFCCQHHSIVPWSGLG